MRTFNRTKIECKLFKVQDNFIQTNQTFNRTKIECKYRGHKQTYILFTTL